MQEELRQKLINEPLLEHQEQYSEDSVQPMTREDAVVLSQLLDNSLPLGSIQVRLRQETEIKQEKEEKTMPLGVVKCVLRQTLTCAVIGCYVSGKGAGGGQGEGGEAGMSPFPFITHAVSSCVTTGACTQSMIQSSYTAALWMANARARDGKPTARQTRMMLPRKQLSAWRHSARCAPSPPHPSPTQHLPPLSAFQYTVCNAHG